MGLHLRVYGIPAAQGSKRHVGGGRMVEMSKRIKPWRSAVYEAVNSGSPIRYEGPVMVRVTFMFDRPKAHYRTGKNSELLRDGAPAYVTRTPDIDKCVRALLDPLTEAGVWHDDAQVVIVHARKMYCERGERPGAYVEVEPVTDQSSGSFVMSLPEPPSASAASSGT